MIGPEGAAELDVWIGGRFVPASEAAVSVFDRGFRSGEGVFETFRSYRGHVFRLEDHLERAFGGASVLGFDPGPRSAIAHAVTATAERNRPLLPEGDGALRLTLTPGALSPSSPFPGTPHGAATVVVTAHPLAIDPAIYGDGVGAARVSVSRELPHVKALSYLAPMLARAEARRRGAHEALLVDEHGHVLEGATSNVFAVIGDTLVTPAVGEGILAGVTRMVVIELATELGIDVEERPLTPDVLATAGEVFLTATTREVVPVVRIDDVAVADGRPGPVTGRIHDAYRAAVASERG